jgi:hypothetical protein
MDVIKRAGNLVSYEDARIKRSVVKASKEAMLTEEEAHRLSEDVVKHVRETVMSLNPQLINVSTINHLVENILKEVNRDVYEVFSYYRKHRDYTRLDRLQGNVILSSDFLSQYKHEEPPMTLLGKIVYYRTYSRWLPTEERYEEWWETCKRAVEFNCSIVPTSVEEAQQLYHNMFHLKQFLSGRALWVSGTEVSRKFPLALYNCAFNVIDNLQALEDTMYLLLLGSGVGVRVLIEDVAKLPKFRTDVQLTHAPYHWGKFSKEDYTQLVFDTSEQLVKIIVGDSKEGKIHQPSINVMNL